MSDATSILATQLSGQIASPSAWLVGTAYTAGQAVSRSGLNYYAISGSTGVDPASDGGVHWGLLSGVGPQPATMAQLYAALMTGIGAMLASRTNRRIGLLNTAAGGQWNVYIDSDVGKVAGNFSEVKEAANLQGNLQSLSSSIARITDPLLVLNTPAASILAWANQLVTYANSYEGLELETLPA
jgi:hypothetical protein